MMHRIGVDGTEIKNRKRTNLVPIYVDVYVFIQHNSSTIVEKVSGVKTYTFFLLLNHDIRT